MMRRIVSAIGVMSLAALGGCQSWSQVGQGFPSNTRVAPPGTGTYNVPSSYYNGGKGAAVGSNIPSTSAGAIGANTSMGTQGRTAGFTQPSTPNEVVPAGYQIPTVDQVRTGINNTASGMLNDMSTRANQAVQNGTSRVAGAVQQYTTPAFENAPPSFAAPAAASQSLSDGPSTADSEAPPRLDWQVPR